MLILNPAKVSINEVLVCVSNSFKKTAPALYDSKYLLSDICFYLFYDIKEKWFLTVGIEAPPICYLNLLFVSGSQSEKS